MHELLRSRFVSLHELRKHLAQILDRLHEEGYDVVITRQGKPVAVIVDVERCLEVQEALAEFSDPESLRALLEARRAVREGHREGVPVVVGGGPAPIHPVPAARQCDGTGPRAAGGPRW